MTHFFHRQKPLATIYAGFTHLANQSLQTAKKFWPTGKILARFANPFYAIKDVTIAIIFSSATALIFHFFWPESDKQFSELDMLGWLLEPAIFATLYLTIGKNWANAGLSLPTKSQALWFLFALCLPTSLSGIMLLINHITGYLTLEPAAIYQISAIGISLIATMLLKSTIEEFVFRGFLTGHFAQMGYGRLKGHLLTGLIWAVWHLTYWFTLIPADKITNISGLPLPIFAILGFITLPLQSILLGELRLITGSIWAGVMLQTLSHIFLASMITANALPQGNFIAILLTPTNFGILYSSIYALIGLTLWRHHTTKIRSLI